MVGAAVSEMVVAIVATYLDTTPPVIAWLASGLLLLLLRLAIIAGARRKLTRGEQAPTGLLAVSSLIWSANLGVGGMLCNLSGDPVLQMFSNACVSSIVAGLAARNAGTPRLAMTQMIIVMSLLSIGAALAPQLWLSVLIIQSAFLVVGLGGICFRGGQDLVAMLDAQHRHSALARHDSLTGLPNRVLLNEKLQELLACSPVADRFALLWLDLDGFKAVNDTLGHAAGDAVLVETARRLRALCVSQSGAVSDRLVARLGGDEFLFLLPLTGPDDALAVAHAVAATVRLPFALPNAPDVRLDASIGIALHPEHGADADALLAAADKALYAVKGSGKARAQVYDPQLHAGDGDLVVFRSELARALVQCGPGSFESELQLDYQAVIRLSDGLLVGREALVRWHHPVRGLVSPGAFVPMAEASGLIIPLGEWVLRRACADAALWADGAKVAVNVSPFQLRTEGFVAVIVQALDVSGLASERLEIEVTETVLLSRDNNTTNNMRHLRELGIKVVLDDFGTGFSSLSNLCSFVFDRIKVDGSFVREALSRRDCAAVVRATVELARHLGVPTTAECIETEAQLDFVRACGCDEVQGFLLARPVPASSVPILGPSASPVRERRPDALLVV